MTVMEKYEYLKSLVVSDRREEFLKFMKWVETETDYLSAPASTQYHLCRKQGLLEHSCNVAATMIRLARTLDPEITDEQCVIVSLLHDLGKVGYPGQPQYIENEPTDKQKMYGYKNKIPYKYNPDILYMPHSHRSIYLILPNFNLSQEECQAILCHDGQYLQDNKSYAHKESKLTVLLHYADYYSCRFLED